MNSYSRRGSGGLGAVGFCSLLSLSAVAQRSGYSAETQPAFIRDLPAATKLDGSELPTRPADRFAPVNIIATPGNGGDITFGILSDGEFTQALTQTEGNSPKTGSFGFNLVYAKPVKIVYFARQEDGKNEQESLVPKGGGTAQTVGKLVAQREQVHPWLVANVLFVTFAQRDPLTAEFNAAAPASITNQKAFGQSMLVPGANAEGGLSFNGNIFIRPRYVGAFSNFGFFGGLNLTQNRWASRDLSTDLSILGSSLGMQYLAVRAFDKQPESNSLQVSVFANYTLRYLMGEIQNDRNAPLVREVLGEQRYTYNGYEVGLIVTLNALRISLGLPVFGGEVSGFSNGRPVFSAGFSTDIRIK